MAPMGLGIAVSTLRAVSTSRIFRCYCKSAASKRTAVEGYTSGPVVLSGLFVRARAHHLHRKAPAPPHRR